MKQFLITFSITVLTVVVGAMLVVSFWGWQRMLDVPDVPIEPAVVLPTATATPNVAATAQARYLAQDEQILTLQTTIQERQVAYESQIGEANRQLSTFQEVIAAEQGALATLNAQIELLEQALAERQQSYPEQLQAASEDVQLRRTELIDQRDAMQTNLIEIHGQ